MSSASTAPSGAPTPPADPAPKIDMPPGNRPLLYAIIGSVLATTAFATAMKAAGVDGTLALGVIVGIGALFAAAWFFYRVGGWVTRDGVWWLATFMVVCGIGGIGFGGFAVWQTLKVNQEVAVLKAVDLDNDGVPDDPLLAARIKDRNIRTATETALGTDQAAAAIEEARLRFKNQDAGVLATKILDPSNTEPEVVSIRTEIHEDTLHPKSWLVQMKEKVGIDSDADELGWWSRIQCLSDKPGIFHDVGAWFLAVLFMLLVAFVLVVSGWVMAKVWPAKETEYTKKEKLWSSTTKVLGSLAIASFIAWAGASQLPKKDECLAGPAPSSTHAPAPPQATPRVTNRDHSASTSQNTTSDKHAEFCARLTKLRAGEPTPAGHVGHTGCPGL